MTLTVNDLQEATKGRLQAADTETARLLAVGTDLVRRWCGWHVTPEQADTVVLDGRGGTSLRLPTLKLVELTSIIEEGVELDLAYLDVSRDGRVVKWVDPYEFYWFDECRRPYWTQRLGGIEVTMNHGYAAAPAWDAAVLSYIARTSMATATGGRHRDAVGPFRYGAVALEDCSAFSAEEEAVLNLYRLEPTT